MKSASAGQIEFEGESTTVESFTLVEGVGTLAVHPAGEPDRHTILFQRDLFREAKKHLPVITASLPLVDNEIIDVERTSGSQIIHQPPPYQAKRFAILHQRKKSVALGPSRRDACQILSFGEVVPQLAHYRPRPTQLICFSTFDKRQQLHVLPMKVRSPL
jgi:hypothetical protein